MARLLTRLGAVFTVGFALTLGFGSVASAHVTVHSGDAVQGGHAELTFRVPTEGDTASTVKVAVAFPTDTPISSISVQPHPGWTYTVSEAALPTPLPDGHGGQISKVVGQVEWSAAGPDTAVKPGEYEVFRVAAGPLPKTDRLIFKVVQTYSDGQVARWIDLPAATGGAEPEHPAPVLTLAAAGQRVAEVAHAGHTTTPVATVSSGTPTLAWWAMAVTAVAVLAALWAVVISLRTVRKRGGEEAKA
jgi:uncharacterized protein YcnI